MAVRLSTLGSARADAPGADAEAITRQPVRFVLLTYLALEGPASRDDVLAKFWGDSPEKRARAALNQTVYQLRQTLGPGTIAVEGMKLSTREVGVDALDFVRAVDEGRHDDALALYSGHFLQGTAAVGTWDLENWIERKRAELRQLHHTAAAGLAAGMAESDDVHRALAFFRRWVALEPLEERPRTELVRLLATIGQRRAALDEFDRYARWLKEELDLEPSEAIEELVAEIRSGELPQRPHRQPSPRGEQSDPPAPGVPLAAAGALRDIEIQKPAGGTDSNTPAPPRSRARLAIPLALVVVGAAVTSVLAGGREQEGASGGAGGFPLSNVAVLEFVEGAGGASNSYLGPALSSTVIDLLSGARGLNVASVAGTRLFQDSAVSLDSLRRALRIGSLVEGRIDRSVGRIRVAVRLVDAATGASLGSRIIERDSTETFQLLDETAQEVAGFLRRAMDTAVRVRRYDAGTESVEAWHLLMAARDLRHTVPGLLRQRRFEEAAGALDRSDATLRSASALDPEWAEPFVERAENAIWRSGAALLAPSTFSEVGWAAIADTAASSAIDLDSTSVTAWVARAKALSLLARLARPALADSLSTLSSLALASATRLDPQSAEAWITWSGLHAQAGRHSEAAVAARHGYEIDPYHPEANAVLYRLFQADFELDRDRSASRWCAEGRRRFPEQPPFVYCSLVLMAWADDIEPDTDRAWALMDSLHHLQLGAQPQLAARFRMLVASVIARVGAADSALATAATARAAGGQDAALHWLEAAVHLQLGDQRRAAALLDVFARVAPEEATTVLRSRPFTDLATAEALVP